MLGQQRRKQHVAALRAEPAAAQPGPEDAFHIVSCSVMAKSPRLEKFPLPGPRHQDYAAPEWRANESFVKRARRKFSFKHQENVTERACAQIPRERLRCAQRQNRRASPGGLLNSSVASLTDARGRCRHPIAGWRRMRPCMIQPPMNGRTQSAAIMSTSLDRSSRRSLALTSRPPRIGLKAMQPTVVMPYHFSALGAGEVGAVMEVVAADLRPVDRRHAEADDELAGEHVRAALGQDEGVRLARSARPSRRTPQRPVARPRSIFRITPPNRWSRRASEGRAVPLVL